MCGIFFHASPTPVDGKKFASLFALLDKRGPDSHALVQQDLKTASDTISLLFYSTVLSLRGSDIVAQPLTDVNSSSQLCWNGEAWSLGTTNVVGNDAEKVFRLILTAAREVDEGVNATDDSIIKALNSITGPFAFVFYDAFHSRVYFGRDSLGRRSLLVKYGDGGIQLSSVGDGTVGWAEVPADGIYVLHFDPNDTLLGREQFASLETVTTHNLTARSTHFAYSDYGKYHTFNHNIPSPTVSALMVSSEPVLELERLLRQSLLIRTESIPYLVVSDNVAIIREIFQGTGFADKEQQGNFADDSDNISLRMHSPLNKRPRVAVLFSGGLDCTVLARMLHDLLPANEEVDLLNVAFHNPRVHGSLAEDASAVYDLCPDRITARASAIELRHICPDRTWRLVEINVPYAEMLHHRDQVVSLMHPHDTEMDLSIALALYFAARGNGTILDQNCWEPRPYVTPARVLVSGLGADELFGGYQRHATAYNRQGFDGLLDELELDINRLGQRNLGRDDRVISHWSKEARYPFLDEKLVEWAVTTPVWDKCGFGHDDVDTHDNGNARSEPEIEAGKMVLRLLAVRLGMTNVAREKKRAIQFGARTAKMTLSKSKSKGTQRIAQET